MRHLILARTRRLHLLAITARLFFGEGASFSSPLCSVATCDDTKGVSVLNQCGSLHGRALVQTSIRKRGSFQFGGREHHQGAGGRAHGFIEDTPKHFRRLHSHLQQPDPWEASGFGPAPAAAGLPQEPPAGFFPSHSTAAIVEKMDIGDSDASTVDSIADDAGDSTTALVGAKGGYTDYIKSSCQQMPLDGKPSFKLNLGMTVSRCFHHCADSPGAKYFALTRGRECFCGAVPLGTIVSSDQCDVKCVGDPTEMCGGVANVASTYSMIDCEPASSAEKIDTEKKKRAKHFASYKVIKGRSCGHSKDNSIKLDGSPVMTGDPELCAEACWEARGAEECTGFTYDSSMEKCTFLSDVADGDVIKKKAMQCYFKKISIDL